MAGTALAILLSAGAGVWLSRVETRSRERETIRHSGRDVAFADSLEAALRNRPGASISAPDALAALYLERLRLGLGSPFRLVDQVLRDNALQPSSRTRLAESMLARTMMGEAYWPRHAALNLVHNGGVPAAGAEHQAIIDSVVAAHDDPRAGELSIRLAYRLASAAGKLSPRAPEIATAAAAQSRDRVLAMRDARALLLAADRDGVSRTTLFRVWREARKFAVERPVIVPLSERAEREAVASLPALVARIENVGAAENTFVESARSFFTQHMQRTRGSELPAKMAAVAVGRDQPPLAPVLVALRGYSGLLKTGVGASMADRAARARFSERVLNEETLAAEYAVLASRTSVAVPEADAALLTAAVALRALGQERAWLSGDPAPSTRDLQARFGVTVTYDAGTRTTWRPYFQRTLEQSLVDMRRILPGFDPRGLRVHFGTSPLGERALALHDPMRRTIYFPPSSHSGVMAHEFAHDLDWQAARRAYGGTGWYRTDHALRQSSDRLAGALRQMASATRGSDTASSRMTGTARPTEVLARNVDWFVSASLAREGRSNGHLSAAQDPVLTGYASAITPEAARDGGSATLRALDGLTSVPEVTRAWFSGLFGTDRRMTVHEAVRRVLETPMGRLNLQTTSPDGPLNQWSVEAVRAQQASWSCLIDSFAGSSSDAQTLRAVMQYAAESRARGIIRQWAAFAEHRPYASPSRIRALTGPPWNPAIEQNTLREIRDAILWTALSERTRSSEGRWLAASTPASGC